jgi:hypothetical protein
MARCRCSNCGIGFVVPARDGTRACTQCSATYRPATPSAAGVPRVGTAPVLATVVVGAETAATSASATLVHPRHAVAGSVVAGLLFAFVRNAIVSGTMNLDLGIAITCLAAGIGAALAAAGIGAANAEIRTQGNIYRAAQSLVARCRKTLLEHPQLAAHDAVRRAILQTDDEVRVLRFNASYATALRDLRECPPHGPGVARQRPMHVTPGRQAGAHAKE